MKDLRGRLEKLEQAARPQGGVIVLKQLDGDPARGGDMICR
jgi:hypothetical protein